MVFSYDEDNFGDVILFCQEGKEIYLHKAVVFSQIPELKDLLCESCDFDHGEITAIFLPDITVDNMMHSAKKLYEYQNPESFLEILELKGFKDGIDSHDTVKRLEMNANKKSLK